MSIKVGQGISFFYGTSSHSIRVDNIVGNRIFGTLLNQSTPVTVEIMWNGQQWILVPNNVPIQPYIFEIPAAPAPIFQISTGPVSPGSMAAPVAPAKKPSRRNQSNDDDDDEDYDDDESSDEILISGSSDIEDSDSDDEEGVFDSDDE